MISLCYADCVRWGRELFGVPQINLHPDCTRTGANQKNTTRDCNILIYKLRTPLLFAVVFFLFGANAPSMAKGDLSSDEQEATRDVSIWNSGDVFRDCSDCPEMVVIPSGTFRMGDIAGGDIDDERPIHNVTIPNNFAVGRYEVTFAEWDACFADGGCGGYRPDDEGWGRGSMPAINVSWNDAQAYINWLSGKTGHTYRLLSEAEWEYAARAGTPTINPWGNTASHDQMNYGADECCSGFAQGKDQWVNTSPVGSFDPNDFGLYDMIGNVWEWTQDCWNDSYTGAPSNGTAWADGDCNRRILRGGSWFGFPEVSRSADRNRYTVGRRDFSYGFRVARTLSQ